MNENPAQGVTVTEAQGIAELERRTREGRCGNCNEETPAFNEEGLCARCEELRGRPIPPSILRIIQKGVRAAAEREGRQH